jgi:hypothetical protein
MERKNILAEMEKIKCLAKEKLQECGGFKMFVVSYSANGDILASLEPWTDECERKQKLRTLVNWLKLEQPYMFVFCSMIMRRKFDKKEDCENNVNYTEVAGILILGRTPSKSYCLSLEHKKASEGYQFAEESLVDETNSEHHSFLDETFKAVN